ncbi:right-handed parallel beta-helix repeat-containing protein [Candidatus Eisenbacteria bacterium]|uniref:Right-handed parallel beta-helix repeat-containing protein n=1 Tax=Eiseniibacteriota bacterium TaxID=2212470 RepID=A0ABV6YKA2_UNCEI
MSRIVALLGLMLMVPALGMATTWQVYPDGSGDYATIQDALEYCSNGDIIDLGDGTYTGGGNRDIGFFGKEATVRSTSGNAAACIIDCQGSYSSPRRGFFFEDGEGPGSVLENITITGCYDRYNGGGIYCYGASPTIRGCRIVDNVAQYEGAGVYCTSSAHPTVEDCIFLDNYLDDYGEGGGMCIKDGCSPTLTRCTFIGNDAHDGPGFYSGNDCYPMLVNCTFHEQIGTAVYVAGNSHITLENTLIAFNSGRALLCGGTGEATLTCCDLYGNGSGDWTDCIASQYGMNGNISLDPVFCDDSSEELTVAYCSPCNEEMNPGCGQIGAWERGCGTAGYLVRADGSGHYPTIQAAIDAIDTGQSVILEDGVYTGPGNRDLDCHGKMIWVQSFSGDPANCVIDCEGSYTYPRRAFDFHSGETQWTRIKGIGIRNGYHTGSVWPAGAAGGVLCRDGASPTFEDCTISDCYGRWGGAINCYNGSNPIFEDCTFNNNTSTRGGAAYINTSCAPAFTGCVMDSNVVSESGGAIYTREYSTPSFTGCQFMTNAAGSPTHGGGGMFCSNSSPTFSDCLMFRNEAQNGGGIYCEHATSSPYLFDVVFDENKSNLTDGEGAGMYVTGATVRLESCLFSEHQGVHGVGMYVTGGGFADLENTHFANNHAYTALGTGAGIHFWGASGNVVGCNFSGGYARYGSSVNLYDYCSPTFTDCRFISNTGDHGGGIYCNDGCSPTVTNCEFNNNAVSSVGGAMVIHNCEPNITGCAFTNNSAGTTTHGGGAIICSSGDPHFQDCEFSENSARYGGAFYGYNTGAAPTFVTCTFDDNHANWDSGFGGAVYLEQTTGGLYDCTFTNNTAYGGGAIDFEQAGSISIQQSYFELNNVQQNGGAVRFVDCSPSWSGCKFALNDATLGGAIYGEDCFSLVSLCTFVGNGATTGGGMYWIEASPTVEYCTFDANSAVNGAGVASGNLAYATILNTIIAFSSTGQAVYCETGSGSPYLQCCDLYNNTHGDWVGCVAGMGGSYGNMSLNPQFCRSQNPEVFYGLEDSSPCAAVNNPGCGQIGAFPVACTSQDVDEPRLDVSALYMSHPVPNPFADLVRVSYGIPSTNPNPAVELGIYDANGRLMRTLVDQTQTSGLHSVTWDGTDAGGASVEGGVYFYKLDVNGESITKRVTVVR